MKKPNIRKVGYHVKHRLFQRDIAVMVLGVVLGLYFVWNALGMLDRNYNLQKQLDNKTKELELARLETASLELEKRFFSTREYQELVARESLGLAMPGERLLVLPDNTQAAKDSDSQSASVAVALTETSNFQQWINFFSGKNIRKISN